MTSPGQKTSEYLFRAKEYVRPDGECFATAVDFSGVPSYYPTALMLSRRPRGVSVKTMEATAIDLVHVGLWGLRERINLNARLEAGAYFDPVEVEKLAEACGVTTAAMRRITSGSVSEIRHGEAFTKNDIITNQQKHRRLTSSLMYFEFVGRMG